MVWLIVVFLFCCVRTHFPIEPILDLHLIKTEFTHATISFDCCVWKTMESHRSLLLAAPEVIVRH